VIPIRNGGHECGRGRAQRVGRALVERHPHAAFALAKLRAQAAIELPFSDTAVAAGFAAQILCVAGLYLVPALSVAVTLLAFGARTAKITVFTDRAALGFGVAQITRAAGRLQRPTGLDAITRQKVFAVAARGARLAIGVVVAHGRDRHSAK